MSNIAANSYQEFSEACKVKLKKNPSTKILHKKGVIKQESVSEVSTLTYLNKFRDATGYKGSFLTREAGFSEFEVKPKDDDDPSKDKRDSKINDHPLQEAGFNRILTLDEIKNGLHGITRTGDGYGYTFTSVRLSGREIEDASLVANFCNLKSIDVSSNYIKSIRNLGAMPYLQKINASRNQIDTFLEMTPVPVALKEVDFSYNSVTSIINMKKFWSLTDINLSHNALTVIEGFSDLEYLQVLNLSHNKIDTIVNLDCPNLLILYLNFNCLDSVAGFLNCHNLRYINLHGNKISKIKGLKYLNELTELHLGDNNIEDISELENLKTLLTLTRIRIHPNPITSLENFRLVLIHMLPQILWMEGHRLESGEIRMSQNIFNPSFRKIAFLDHTTILLDRACQAANTIFDDHCRTRPFPPVLLLVGTPRSQSHRLALLLKQRFKNMVYLGGVHSTATTMEGSNPTVDIPISFESFKDMKNRGEFLATSQILGRVCGFATSQIARAAEKGALLVAAVPLTTAISLREWKLRPKLILVLPSAPPQLPETEERYQTIRRSFVQKEAAQQLQQEEMDESDQKIPPGEMDEEEVPIEVEKDPTQIDEMEPSEENKDHHLVNFAEMLSIVQSMDDKLAKEPIGDEVQDVRPPGHSILKSPHFEVEESLNNLETFDDYEDVSHIHSAVPRGAGSKNKLSPMFIEEQLNAEVDLEKKKKARLKSLAPGMERYNLQDDDDDDDDKPKKMGRLKSLAPGMEKYNMQDDDDDDDEVETEAFEEATEDEAETSYEVNYEEEGMKVLMETTTDKDDKKGDTKQTGTTIEERRKSARLSKKSIVTSSLNIRKKSHTRLSGLRSPGMLRSQVTSTNSEGSGASATRYVTTRPRRLNRLASLLMLQTDQRLSSSLNITDILMNLPSMEKVDPKLLQTVDMSAPTVLIDQTDSKIIPTEQGPITIASISVQNEDGTSIQPRSTLIPPSFSILQDPSPLRVAPVGNQRFVGNYDLMIAKEQSKRAKEAEAALRGEKVKTSSDDATAATTANPVTVSTQDKKSQPRKTQNVLNPQKDVSGVEREDNNATERNNFPGDPLQRNEIINQEKYPRNEKKSKKKCRKCKHHHHKSSKCKSRKNKDETKDEVKGTASKYDGENPKSKGRNTCLKRGQKPKRLIGPSNAFDWRGREIGEPEENRKPNFDRDIKRGVFYDGEFSKFSHEKSMEDEDLELSQDSFLLKTGSVDKNVADDADIILGDPLLSNNNLDETKVPEDKSSGQVEADVLPENLRASQEPELLRDDGSAMDNLPLRPMKSKKKKKKKGLRFQGASEEEEPGSKADLESSVEEKIVKSNGLTIDDENLSGQQQDFSARGKAVSEDEGDDGSPSSEKPRKIKAPVKMSPSEAVVGDDHEDHHFKHKEAIESSILQTREEYAEFHLDNPGFFHSVLDTSDLCESYSTLEGLAYECLKKYKHDHGNAHGIRGSVKSHAGMNKVDEKAFLAERMKHFKKCASIWAKGDAFTASVDSGKCDDTVDKRCEIFFEKPSCPKDLLQPTLHRPGITLKMKRIVELHDKRIRCSNAKSC